MDLLKTLIHARAQKQKKKKNDRLSEDFKRTVLNMKPEELAVEAVRESAQLDKVKEQKATDHQIIDLKEKIKEFNDDLNNVPAVVEAKEKLKQIKQDNMTPDQQEHRIMATINGTKVLIVVTREMPKKEA